MIAVTRRDLRSAEFFYGVDAPQQKYSQSSRNFAEAAHDVKRTDYGFVCLPDP